ncbi:hypothetical protein COCNU_05G004840 [Cocos nucifera]|uniref:Uncharacterized protein n=1 Tax=Cocos nucifera TaxID=13894 RepID=A0A8K0I8B1_COCNU|nr:hypothetical protein COCNU_05G004840 [Cocos nucifera]
MTLEEQNHLTKEIKSLKRKGSATEEPLKKARIKEPVLTISIQVTPALETTMAILSPTLPNEDAIRAPLDQDEIAEKKKKKVIRKRTRRMIENSSGEGSSQE